MYYFNDFLTGVNVLIMLLWAKIIAELILNHSDGIVNDFLVGLEPPALTMNWPFHFQSGIFLSHNDL